MKEMLEMYKQLNEKQRAKIFTAEQMKCLDGLVFFEKLFNDSSFYKTVEKAVGEEVYEVMRAQA